MNLSYLAVIFSYFNGISFDILGLTVRIDWLIALFVSILSVKMFISDLLSKFKIKYIYIFFTIISFYIILITIFNKIFINSSRYIIIYLINIGTFTYFYRRTKLTDLKHLAKIIFYTGLIISVITLLFVLISSITHSPNIFVKTRFDRNLHRFLYVGAGTCIEPNIFASYVYISYLSFLFLSINKKKKINFYIINLVYLLAIIVSYTRSVWILTAVLLAVYTIKYLDMKRKIIIAIASIFIAIFGAGEFLIPYMNKLAETNPLEDTDIQVRILRAMAVINSKHNAAQVLFGNGVGQIKTIEDSEYYIKSSETKWSGNLIVYWYGEFGVFGIFLILFVIVIVYKNNIKIIRSFNIYSVYSIYYFSFFSLMFVFMFTQTVLQLFPWIITAVLLKSQKNLMKFV